MGLMFAGAGIMLLGIVVGIFAMLLAAAASRSNEE